MAIGYQKTLSALRDGDRIMVTNPDPMRPAETVVYALASSGKRVLGSAFMRLRENLIPVPDGLFGAEMAQTYRWQEPTA